MKATFQIPDDLYREMKMEAAREGRTMREVTIQLFQQWLVAQRKSDVRKPRVNWRTFRSPLASFVAKQGKKHSIEAMRASIVKGRQAHHE